MKREIREDSTEPTIDLALWARTIWESRVLIIKIVAISIALGIIFALVTPRRYTAKVILAPESSNSSSDIASAASMLGLSPLNLPRDNDALSVAIYPDIVASTPFIIELLKTPVQKVDSGQTMTLFDYLQSVSKVQAEGEIDSLYLTKGQAKIVEFLRRALATSIDKKSGVTTISATFQDPKVAAIVARQATDKLRRYVTDYRTSKAEHDLAYWQQLYKRRQEEYYEAQQSYADYVDANHKVTRQSIINERERLQNEKLLALQLYTTVATQMQMARAKVEEAKPVFTIIEPATIPLTPSNVGRVAIVIRFLIAGLAVATLWVLFGHDFLKSVRK